MDADLALDHPSPTDGSTATATHAGPPTRVAPRPRDELERFRRDPRAFAQAAGAGDAAAFLARYRSGVDQRLSDVVGAPPAGRVRLATWTPELPPPGDAPSPDAPPSGDRDPRRHRPDIPPQMGALLLLGVVVLVAATTASTLAMIKRERP